MERTTLPDPRVLLSAALLWLLLLLLLVGY